MARIYGDLSADTPDPVADWNSGGMSKMWWDFIMRLPQTSSRCIAGEAGQFALCKDAITQDARMVPLMRAMAQVKDDDGSGVDDGGGKPIHTAKGFNPFVVPA
jgi:hypothetical protein